MASSRSSSILVVAVVLLAVLASGCAGAGAGWKLETGTALATWSGAPEGAGSEAGECGYYSAIKDWPWGSNVTAVSPNMFRGGAACGTCWDLKVEDGDETIRVVATDVCRGGPCAVADYHFELSGHAFGLLANRSSGHITVSYTRVNCERTLLTVYRVDGSSTTTNFMVTPIYIQGYESVNVTLRSSGNDVPMTRVRGAVWQADASSLQLPYEVIVYFLLADKGGLGHGSVGDGIIPLGWEPGHTYVSPVAPPNA